MVLVESESVAKRCYQNHCQWCFETVDGEMGCSLTMDDYGFKKCYDMTVDECPWEGIKMYDFIDEHMEDFLVDGSFDFDTFKNVMMLNGYSPIRLTAITGNVDRLIYVIWVSNDPVTIVSLTNGMNYLLR